MYSLDKKNGNTGTLGRYFWRIENIDGKGAQEKCFAWAFVNFYVNFNYWYNRLIKSDWQMACPCSFWQAWLDWGRFSWSWWYSWPELCFVSRRSKFIYLDSTFTGSVGFRLRQECCYSTQSENWGSLKIGPPDGGRVKVTAFYGLFNRGKTFYTDDEAYKYCCVDIPWCNLFYLYRPSDSCSLYRPPRRRKFSVTVVTGNVMSGYPKTRHVMSHVMSCHAMPCHAMLCHVILYSLFVVSCFI